MQDPLGRQILPGAFVDSFIIQMNAQLLRFRIILDIPVVIVTGMGDALKIAMAKTPFLRILLMGHFPQKPFHNGRTTESLLQFIDGLDDFLLRFLVFGK